MEYILDSQLRPENDAERVQALQYYQILNTPAEPEFDNIVKLAKTIFKVPIAHISFLDAEHEFVKAIVGLEDVVLVAREDSMCAIAVCQPDAMVVEDALLEPFLINHSAVAGPLGLRFYAAAPVINADGFIIGTLCLVDMQPRTLNPHELEILKDMASVVMDQVELRLSNIEKTKEQKAINEKLFASQERLQRILDTMAEGVTIVDETGKLTYANIMAQKIFGLTESQLKHRAYNDPKWINLKIDGSVFPEEEHPMVVVRRTGQSVFDKEIGIQMPEGERFYISVNAAPIFDEEGLITGAIGTFMDVTNRRKLLKQKEEFISIASHELKTPITALKASIQLLDKVKDNPDPEKRTKLITQAGKSLDKLIKLVDDLLNTNRITEGQLALNKTRFNIAQMVNQCCQHVANSGTHEIELKGDPGLQIDADEQQIEQVLINLVNNAVKYAPNSKQIVVALSKEGGYAKVSVTDRGPGVPSDKIPLLFDRYFRADYSSVQFSGLGLGLYISSEIIKKHGGNIGLDSTPGEGSTFWFTLPLEGEN